MAKREGRHPENALTAIKVRQVREPGRYADGNGLYLVVEPSGAKRWLLRTVVQGRRRDIGLGGLSLTSLAEARAAALTYRKLARDGGDPIAERRKTRVRVPTFAEAAEIVHADNRASWRNDKHAAQWISTLRQYVFPTIGAKRVDGIDTPDVLRVLAPVWMTKPETARRVRQRIGTVLDWAKAAGHRDGENPVAGVGKGLPRQVDRDEHHAALAYMEVPRFVSQLRSGAGVDVSRLALEFLILTAGRTGEVLGARWSEIDESDKLWAIPGERMKARRMHRVPLSPRCMDILDLMKPIAREEGFVFPGKVAGRPLSNMALLMLLRRLKAGFTAHGFRSSFRDWASETTNHPREVAEMALAHTLESKVEAAYRRGDLLERRRQMMDDWERYINQQ